MKKIVLGARIFLGLIFFVFGLNGFFQFIPLPEMKQEALNLMMAFAGAGYFFPLVKITEIVAGALLLTNLFVPFAIVLLAPIIVQIFALHFFLDPGGLPMSFLLVGLEVFLALSYRDYYKDLFTRKATP